MDKVEKIPGDVMIVEDEEDLCYLLKLIFKKQNLKTACAGTLVEAKQAISTFEPKFLLLDNNLPDGSGTEFIKQVKSLYPATKVIMITAHDSPGDIQNAFHKGADYFISKPFSWDAIEKALGNFKLGNTA